MFSTTEVVFKLKQCAKPYNSLKQYKFMFHYLNFLSEQTITFVPVTAPARLPGSYEKALNTSKREKATSLILFLIYPKKKRKRLFRLRDGKWNNLAMALVFELISRLMPTDKPVCSTQTWVHLK